MWATFKFMVYGLVAGNSYALFSSLSNDGLRTMTKDILERVIDVAIDNKFPRRFVDLTEISHLEISC